MPVNLYQKKLLGRAHDDTTKYCDCLKTVDMWIKYSNHFTD